MRIRVIPGRRTAAKEIFLVICIVLCRTLPAQPVQFRHLTIENGLSQSTINCLLQDQTGFMWIGTQDGLNRFDGYNFRIFRPEAGKASSISAIDIWAIHQTEADSGRVLWVGTHGGGLNVYDVVNNKFHHFLDLTGDAGHPVKNIRTLESVCLKTRRIILAGSLEHGLFALVLKPGWYEELGANKKPWEKIWHVTRGPAGLSHNSLSELCVDTVISTANHKSIWIGTYGGGLNRIDIAEPDPGNIDFAIWQVDRDSQDRPIVEDDLISSMLIEKTTNARRSLWLGTQDGLKELLLDRDSLTGKDVVSDIRVYRMGSGKTGDLPNNEIYALTRDRSGALWIGSYDGLVKVSRMNQGVPVFETIRHDPLNNMSLSENHIISLYVDQAGIFWAGTHGNGINLYDRYASKFKHYRDNPASALKINDSNVKSIFEDPDADILWIGTHSGGLNRIDLARKTVACFNSQATGKFRIGHNRIIKIFQDSGGDLWLGTYRGGVLRFGKNRYTCRQYKNDPGDTTSLSDDDVNSIIEDSRGNLWIGTYGGGLNRFDYRTQKFIRYQHIPGEPSSLSNDLVRCILKDSDERLWIGSEGGLSLLIDDPAGNISFKNYINELEIRTNHIFCLHEGVRYYPGQLWIGTEGGGLYRFDPESENLVAYTTADGLPNDVVYGILEDDAGMLWISTNYGLSKFDPVNGSFTNFTVRDGLQSNEFNLGACCRRRNGELLFGGVNGITAFYPRDIRANPYQPPVVLTNLEILNKPVSVGSEILPRNLNFTRGIELEYTDNIFALEFAALHFYAPEKNRYAYRMEGFDQNWINVDATRRFITYTNLDPGSYRFIARGTNNDGVWSSTEKELKITIRPPYWQTWWFRAGLVLVILAVLYLIYRIRVNRLLEIERLRIQIASDLHDDVGSALTKIALNSELIQSVGDMTRVQSISKKIGSLSREIITTMSDVVWSIDSRNDLIRDLIDRMKDFAYSVLSAQDILVKFNISGLDVDRRIPVNYRQNIFLIFKEAVNNIARHSGATTVTVNLTRQDGGLRMELADNGRGFDQDRIRTGNGLTNMKMRAGRINGQLAVDSSSGVRITLIIPKL